MTLREFLGILRRRWYVVLAVVAIVAVITVDFARDSGTYTTRTQVLFTLPTANTLTRDNGSTNDSIIAFAGTVAAQVSPRRPAERLYSRLDAPLYGAGEREAVTVALRNEGSQWSTSYASATIEVEIVGRTYEWVSDRQGEILSAIEDVAISEQVLAGVPKYERIAVHVQPLTTVIEHIVPSRLAQMAAATAMLGAAMLVGAWGAAKLDRAVGRRRLTAGRPGGATA